MDYRIPGVAGTYGQGNLDQAMDILMMLNTIVPEHPLLLLSWQKYACSEGGRGALVS